MHNRLLLTLAMTMYATTALAAAPPSTQELLDRVDALEKEVAELKAERSPQKVPAVESRATIGEIQTDAQRRSQLVDLQPLNLGYHPNRGLIIQSDDGRFLIHPWLFVQIRNDTTYRQDAVPEGGTQTDNGFELRRFKLGIDGNLYSKDLTYQFIQGFDRHNGNPMLEDAWVKYAIPGTPYFVRGGQIRNPLDHEQITFGTQQLTVERSLVADIFAGGEGLVQGVAVGYDDGGAVRAEVAFTDGLRSQDTDFEDFPDTPANWGASGRVEWKLTGDWNQYRAFSALGAKSDLLVLGAGMDFTEAGDTGQFTHVVDAHYASPSGLSLYAAYVGRYTANNQGPPNTNGGSAAPGPSADTYDPTFRVQAGYLVYPTWEPFVRYEYIHFDPAELTAGAEPVLHEFTAGINHYIYGQRAKFSLDLSYLPNGSPVKNDSSGVLINSGSNEWILRLQFQFML